MSTELIRKATRAADGAPQPQVVVELDADAFAAFKRAVDRPSAPSAKLRRLLKMPAPWES